MAKCSLKYVTMETQEGQRFYSLPGDFHALCLLIVDGVKKELVLSIDGIDLPDYENVPGSLVEMVYWTYMEAPND